MLTLRQIEGEGFGAGLILSLLKDENREGGVIYYANSRLASLFLRDYATAT